MSYEDEYPAFVARVQLYGFFLLAFLLMSPALFCQAYYRDPLEKKIGHYMGMPQREMSQDQEQVGYVEFPKRPGAVMTEEFIRTNAPKLRPTIEGYLTWHSEFLHDATASAPGIDLMHHFVNSFLVGNPPFKTDSILEILHTVAMCKQYEYDDIQYGKNRKDIWQNSRQAFLHAKGDCEDHAILLADWLIDAGYDARVVLGYTITEGHHAWVVLIEGEKEMVLEATERRIWSKLEYYPQLYRPEFYIPHFQFNRDSFWINHDRIVGKGYRSPTWELISHFVSQRPAPEIVLNP